MKYISLTHDRKVFLATHNSISIPRHVSCQENNNIANSHLPLINLLSFERKSPTSLISSLNFSRCTFSLPEISFRIFHHVFLSVKFSVFYDAV